MDAKLLYLIRFDEEYCQRSDLGKERVIGPKTKPSQQ